MAEDRYTPREFAKKMMLNEEYVRQCCRVSHTGATRLPAGWVAIRDDRARRWYIVPSEAEGVHGTVNQHEILADKIVQAWHELWSLDSMVWEKNLQQNENVVLHDAAGLLFSIGQTYCAVKQSKISKRLKLQLTLDLDGKWQAELVAPLTEPFLFDRFRYGGFFRTLLSIWQCALGLSTQIDGGTYQAYSGDKYDFEQFASFSICLNCGRPYVRRTGRRLYCGDECRVSFLRWFERIHQQSRKRQAESICKRVSLIAKRYWKSSINARSQSFPGERKP